MLIIRVASDKQHIESVAQELHRAQSWAYKWCKRYSDEGLEGLRDKPRSGKPSVVSKEVREKIKQELSNSNTGWDIKQVMDLIQKKTGVKHHKEHIRRLLHKWGFSPKVPKKGLLTPHPKKKRIVLKKVQQALSTLNNDWNVLVQDESIFIHDSVLAKKRKWILKGKRPVVTVTGSHDKTIVYGVLSLDGKQLFRQYERFDSHSFIAYLEEIRKKFKKFIMFVDRATQHRSKMVEEYCKGT